MEDRKADEVVIALQQLLWGSGPVLLGAAQTIRFVNPPHAKIYSYTSTAELNKCNADSRARLHCHPCSVGSFDSRGLAPYLLWRRLNGESNAADIGDLGDCTWCRCELSLRPSMRKLSMLPVV